jgi:hypothetical protein
MIDWQPMETAPKDGSTVILKMPEWYGGRTVETYWFEGIEASGWRGYYGPSPEGWRSASDAVAKPK